jgi:hypothetical protein
MIVVYLKKNFLVFVALYMYTDWDALELKKDIIFAEWNESDVPKNDPVSNNKKK